MEKAFTVIWPHLLVTFIIFCLVCLIKTVFSVGWIAALGVFGGLVVVLFVRIFGEPSDAEQAFGERT